MSRPRQEYHPVQERGEVAKHRILDQALRLFSCKGYHGTNTKEISAAAGLSTGSFYRYFRDKKAVFLGVCKRLESGMQEDIFGLARSLQTRGLTPRDILAAVVNRALQAHAGHRDFHQEVLTLQARDPEVAKLVAKRQARVEQQLLDFFLSMQKDLRVGDLSAAVRLIHWTVEEVAFQTVIQSSDRDVQTLQAECVDMLARYLLKEPGN